ncbi:FecR domain-containing protein [Dyadobacter sp. LJ53]|uniref:FecR family protein n=1 Tax=Dyadobacter chenwenxiniae TaxID=2906456 RepID=UPI001F2DC32F|nr:FecR family protein [Dyadobacter chenwenxiniae]MCF0049787.1 FecR domain-containing protein [Dyadobacter chenwenxiniae]
MDQYHNFTLEDFLWDPFFRNWVLKPTREDEEYWQNWLTANPEKTETVRSARELVLSIAPLQAPLSKSEKENAVRQIIGNIHNEEEPAETSSQIRIYQPLISIAAVLIVIAGLSWTFWSGNQKQQINYDELVSTAAAPLIEKTNQNENPLSIKLTDGSIVTLDPGSKVSYPANFEPGKREVYLSGKAFFDIAKDPSRPFFVYANEVITKVLGTSFTVRSYTNEKEVSVAVKTGRVAVFTRKDPEINEKKDSRELTGVVIEPNQQIVFVRESIKMTKSLIPSPELVDSNISLHNFEFDETPVSEVFSELQKAYGIEIIFDKNIMNECPITARLSEMTLYEKLDLICKAVGASYELIDGRIIVEGKGCKNI